MPSNVIQPSQTIVAFTVGKGYEKRLRLINWLDHFAEGPSLIRKNDICFDNEQDAVIFRLSYVK